MNETIKHSYSEQWGLHQLTWGDRQYTIYLPHPDIGWKPMITSHFYRLLKDGSKTYTHRKVDPEGTLGMLILSLLELHPVEETY
jgi:hypothetical protein